MIIAVNTRLLLERKMSGIGWFTYHTLKNMVLSHPNHKFVFLFDRPFNEKFVFSDNVFPEIIAPQARHPFLYYIWFNYSIVPTIKKHKADVFLSPDGLLSLHLPKIVSIPVIHDINFHHFPEQVPFLMRHYYNHYFPKYVKIAKRIITVSEYSKNDIVGTYGIDSSIVDVAYNGVSEDFRVIDEDTKKKVKEKYSEGNDYFLYVGDLLPRKNIPTLINAFSLFKGKTLSLNKLLIVGKKVFYTSEIQKVYNESKYKNDIIFTGELPQEDLVNIVGSCKALMFISLFEGFGIPLVEGMRAGVPVITSNISCMPEIAGDAALLVDPYSIESVCNAMIEISLNERLRNELIEKGLKHSQKYSWTNTANIVWSSIEKAVSM